MRQISPMLGTALLFVGASSVYAPRVAAVVVSAQRMNAFTTGAGASGASEYSVKALVLQVDKAHKILVASCQSIPGYMDAMVMPYPVRDSKELDGVEPGMMVEFKLVVDSDSAYAESIRVHDYEGLEQDPLTARRLNLINTMPASSSPPMKVLEIGERVPEFTLTDQTSQRVTLSQFAGKVVAITFVYTRCPLPNFCYRLSNNFGRLQKRFADQMGKNLVFLSISFDPVHDQPDVLADYASIWKADPKGWHLLTGPLPDVKTICHMFGMNFWQDEGLMNHSLHTVIIGRDGKLSANLEGNEFTADQLGDLLQAVLNQPTK